MAFDGVDVEGKTYQILSLGIISGVIFIGGFLWFLRLRGEYFRLRKDVLAALEIDEEDALAIFGGCSNGGDAKAEFKSTWELVMAIVFLGVLMVGGFLLWSKSTPSNAGDPIIGEWERVKEVGLDDRNMEMDFWESGRLCIDFDERLSAKELARRRSLRPIQEGQKPRIFRTGFSVKWKSLGGGKYKLVFHNSFDEGLMTVRNVTHEECGWGSNMEMILKGNALWADGEKVYIRTSNQQP